MTDTADDGGVINDAIARTRIALDALREQLAEKAAEIGQEVNARLDEIQEAIDQIQQYWQSRPAPDNTLPGDLPPEPTQLPADAAGVQAQQQPESTEGTEAPPEIPQSQGGGTTPTPTIPS